MTLINRRESVKSVSSAVGLCSIACRLSCLLAIVLSSAAAIAQDLSPEVHAKVAQRIELQRKWGGALNSPGADLSAVEIKRATVDKRSVIAYELHVKGLPVELDYQLFTLPTMAGSADELQPFGDVHIDKQDGRIIDGPDDPRTIIVADPAPGEPYRFALQSKDHKYRAFVVVLPNPVEGTDQGCKFNVVRLTPNFELAFIQASGFPPQSEITFHGDSAGEVHELKVKTNDAGYADFAILPYKKGLSTGRMEMRLTSPKCAPKATFTWGSTH